MIQKRRRVEPGCIYHVLNRGAQRQNVFLSDSDYVAFEELILETLGHTPLVILTYELMPNHWHFVVRPEEKSHLSSFFQYLAGTHSKRFRSAMGTVGQGHVYQDRFKSFPVQSDGHLLAVCRYVERNALRAGFVSRAEHWPWSGLWRRMHSCDDWLTSNWPVRRPRDWVERVNQALTTAELAAIRHSIRRGRPLGEPQWTRRTAERLHLAHTLRSRGRPRLTATPHV